MKKLIILFICLVVLLTIIIFPIRTNFTYAEIISRGEIKYLTPTYRVLILSPIFVEMNFKIFHNSSSSLLINGKEHPLLGSTDFSVKIGYPTDDQIQSDIHSYSTNSGNRVLLLLYDIDYALDIWLFFVVLPSLLISILITSNKKNKKDYVL